MDADQDIIGSYRDLRRVQHLEHEVKRLKRELGESQKEIERLRAELGQPTPQ
jgi:predicted RNase H-like nuclease (RuvC/YqgF family)